MQLSDRQKTAVALKDDGRSYSEIASTLNCSRSAAAGLVTRARSNLGIPKVSKKVAASRGAVAAKRRRSTKRKPARQSHVFDAADYLSGRPMIDLGEGECRWPVTPHDAGPRDHRFCGAPCRGGNSYCDAHQARTA